MDASDVWAQTIVNYSSAAALAFLVWDICITFEAEVEYIWSKGWTNWTKPLFLFVRYFSVIAQASMFFTGFHVSSDPADIARTCRIWFIWQSVAVQAETTAAETILLIRVYALYGRRCKWMVVLLLLFAGEIVAMVFSIVLSTPKLEFDQNCSLTMSPFSILIYGAADIAFETVLLLLTLFKFYTAGRHGWENTPVLTSLARDGTWAFALIFVTLVINSVFFVVINNALSALGFSWIFSMLSFSGCRLLLNMQRMATPSLKHTSIAAANGAATPGPSSVSIDGFEMVVIEAPWIEDASQVIGVAL